MDNIESITFKINRTVKDHDVTLNIPIQAALNRHIFFPDFGIEISNDTPLPAVITQDHLNAEKVAGRMVAEEFLDIYPEVLSDLPHDQVITEIENLYTDAWVNSTDLDLSTFHGVKPHSN